MMDNIYIETLIDGIKKQYTFGEALVKAIDPIVEQAMAANVLVEENYTLAAKVDELKTKVLQLGGSI